MRRCSSVMACLLRIVSRRSAITFDTDSNSVSEPKPRSPCTASGSTTSSCGMWGMTKERRLRRPRVPTVPGEPGGNVGSSVSTPSRCSTMIWRVRTGLGANRFICSSLPYRFGIRLMAAVIEAISKAGLVNGFCMVDQAPTRTRTPSALS